MRIEPSRSWASLKLGEVWAFRELLLFLTWRDIKVRYKQTALGAIWAILQPLLNAVIFWFLFNRVAKLPIQGANPFLFTFASMVPWQFFAFGLAQAANSIVQNNNLIKKVYFPRLTVPIATVLSGFIDFCIAFVILLLMMPFFHARPSVNMVFLPVFTVLAFIASLGSGLWLSALNVQYRDVRYVVGFLVQFWMLATPIAWSISRVPNHLRWIVALNPMTSVVEGFRWSVLGTPVDWLVVATGTAVSLALLVSGVIYFRRMERTFADVV